MTDKLTRLLDDVEDAEHDLARAYVVRRWWCGASAMFAVAVTAMGVAAFFTQGDARAGFVLAAAYLFLFGGSGLIIWAVEGDIHTDVTRCERQLRKARRARRDYILEDQPVKESP